MNATRGWSGVVVAVVLAQAGCSPSSKPTPPGPPPVVLEILHRAPSGALEGVAGITVQRSDVATGAFVEARTTDATGKADFGAVAGPVTLTVVRPAPAAGGTARAFTLLGLPAGTARLRLDRLPDEPGTPLTTVAVPLAPALDAFQRASAWTPTGEHGQANPGDAVLAGIPLTDRDLQSDGRITLLAQVDDNEMGTAVGCRRSVDQAVTASTNTLAAGIDSPPIALVNGGTMLLDRVVVTRKGTAIPLPAGPTCASAFADADGFSVQGSVQLGRAMVGVANYFQEDQASEQRGATWLPGPAIAAGANVIVPSSDVSIEALGYGTGAVHATLKGTAVRSLVAAHARISWSASATETRVWHVYAGLGVTAGSCDGTATDPACTVGVKLPAVAAMGVPPDQQDGMWVEADAVALAGATSAADFWSRLAAEGDAEAVLARGSTGAHRINKQSLPSYLVDVTPFVKPGWYPYGKVVGSGGIDCSPPASAACLAWMPAGTQVSLTATPNAGAELVGWLGAPCSGFGAAATISFPLANDTYCYPDLRPATGSGAQQLNVNVISAGNGWITSDDGMISCGYDPALTLHASCTFNYPSGYLVVLNATPTDSLNPYKLTWGGDCAGSSSPTTVIMSAPRNCSVDFTRP